MKRLLLSCVALVAVVGIVTFLTTGGGPDVVEPVPHFGGAEQRDEILTGQRPADLSRADAARRPEAAPSPEPVRQEAAPEPLHTTTRTEADVLRLFVADERRLPVLAADVHVFRRPWADARAHGETDIDGRFDVQAQPGDEVRVEAEGMAQRSIVVPERPWPDPFEVTLSPGTIAIAGTIVDDVGQPVSGARIELSDGSRQFTATTKEGGRFEIRLNDGAPALRAAEIWLHAPGHVFLGNGAVTPLPEAGTDGWEITMHRSARATIRVVDSQDTIVRTARATLLGAPEEGDRRLLPGLGSAVHASRRGEELWFDVVPPLTPLWVSVEEASLGRREVLLGEVSPGESREVRVDFATVWDPRLWHFVATDGSNPVGGGRVVVSSDGGSASWVEIAPDGAFAVDPPSERFALEVQVPGFDVERRSLMTTDPPSGPVEIALHPSSNFVRARVVDQRGIPQPAILVRVEQAGLGGMKLALRTDEKGRIEYRGIDANEPFLVRLGDGKPGMFLPPGDGRDLVSAPAAYRNVRANGPDLEFTLVPPASVAGTIEGQALEGAGVSLSCFETIGAPLPPVFSVTAPLSAAGEFYFTGLPPGRYHLWSTATSSGNTIDRPLATIDLHAGQELREVRVRP